MADEKPTTGAQGAAFPQYPGAAGPVFTTDLWRTRPPEQRRLCDQTARDVLPRHHFILERLRDISLGHFPFPIYVAILPGLLDNGFALSDQVLLRFVAVVPERDTGGELRVQRDVTKPAQDFDMLIKSGQFEMFIARELRDVVVHELEEAFLFRSERIFDPHLEENRRRNR